MDIVPFEINHAKELFPILGLPMDHLPESYLQILATPGWAFTAMEVGQVYGFAGITILWPGVADAYCFMQKEMTKHPFSLHRAVKRHISEMAKEFKLHRIQIVVEFGHEIGYKWAEALGFSKEGAMPMYGPNKKTYMRFGRIWPHYL